MLNRWLCYSIIIVQRLLRLDICSQLRIVLHGKAIKPTNSHHKAILPYVECSMNVFYVHANFEFCSFDNFFSLHFLVLCSKLGKLLFKLQVVLGSLH